MGISIWQLLIILLIVLLLFGTKRLKSIGADLGGAVKGFRDSMGEKKAEEAESADANKEPLALNNQVERVIDGEVSNKPQDDKVSR